MINSSRAKLFGYSCYIDETMDDDNFLIGKLLKENRLKKLNKLKIK